MLSYPQSISGREDSSEHGSLHTSSTTLAWTREDFPELCSTNATGSDRKQDEIKQPEITEKTAPVPTENQGERKQAGNTEDSASAPVENQREGGQQTRNAEDSTTVSEICRPGLQDNLAIAEPEDNCSDSKSIVSEGPAPPAQQGLIKDSPKRLQLYSCRSDKFSYSQLSNPKTWPNIAYARLGWIPNILPYLQPGKRYWELKANSTVISASMPQPGKGHKKKVPVGVTCYMHVEGPWCEVQSHTGTRICILVAPPPTPRIPPLIEQGPLDQNAREDVWRGQRPRVHPAFALYPSK